MDRYSRMSDDELHKEAAKWNLVASAEEGLPTSPSDRARLTAIRHIGEIEAWLARNALGGSDDPR